jgi:Sulfatase
MMRPRLRFSSSIVALAGGIVWLAVYQSPALFGWTDDPQSRSGPPKSNVLPYPEAPFAGKIGRTTADSKSAFPTAVTAPARAPNVLLIMTDDVGFGASSTFGGSIPTPNFDKLAARGVKYNRFHTTALCSPTRASLITGRNHHNAHTGIIMERSLGYPGYDSVMPKSCGTVAEVFEAEWL